MTFETDAGIFAKQLRQLGATLEWIGSASNATATALKLGGLALNGTYVVVDFNKDSSPTAQDFSTRYDAAYKSNADLFGAWTFDAVTMLAEGIKNAGSTDPNKIREAILAIKDKPGAEGIYLRPERRRPSRLQYRQKRERHDQVSEARRLQGLERRCCFGIGTPL